MRTSSLLPWVAALVLAPLLQAQAPPAGTLLWEIGKPDGDNREFALAPGRYGEFREDGFFLAGTSDPRQDWPYVQPGPDDAWAGGRSHTFTVLFGLAAAPAEGQCRLRFRLLDTQRGDPPRLRITVNEHAFDESLPAGAGDDSISGQPAKGRPHQFEVRFPADDLKAGENQVHITTVSGSWFLYDWVGLETPGPLELKPVASRTVVTGIEPQPVLVERGGRLSQTINVSLRHLGGDTDAAVRVSGVESPTALRLKTGSRTVEIAVPAVDRESRVHVAVAVGARTLAEKDVTLKPVRRWVVYLLPHSHVDIGYTHVQTEVEQAQWRYLEMAMEAARRSAGNAPGERFKWNVEVLWAVDSYLRQATPEKQQAFLEAVRAGQVGLQALYGNELTGLCRPEELLRLVGFAQQLARRVGRPIESAMITDVPGYTWGLVPTFAHSGVKYFSIGPNGGDRIGNTITAWGDKPFWWIGPNGRDKALVWMTGTGYYQVFQSPEKLMAYLAQLEARAYPYDFVQVRHCLGDNGAPDVGFADKVKAWNATHAYPRLVIATSEDMFHDFERRYGDRLPTARGDFTPYWEDGAASSARETALNRASADRLTQAETVYALFAPKAYPSADFYQAWRNVVLYDEHTWGAYNSISEPDHPFVKSQWAIKQANALDADRQSRQLLALADAARGAQPAANTDPRTDLIDVLNTTGFRCPDELVFVPKALSASGDLVRPAVRTGRPCPSQRLSSGELVFRTGFGPFAAQRFEITPGAPQRGRQEGAKAEGNTLTTPGPQGLHLRLDEKSGAIASLRFGDRELVDPRAATALNDYFYLPGSDLRGLQRSAPVRIRVGEAGPLIASLIVESDAPGCRKLTREVRVQAVRNCVELINTVDKLPIRTKEGLHLGFGFQVPGGVMRMDVPWAVVRPETDQIPGACKNWFTVQRWVDISNPDYGVTWLTPDAPLVEVGGITANLIGSQTDPKAWITHLAPSTTFYSWVMNNHWHTNYRADQEGPTVFRYLIWPHRGSFDSLAAARRGQVASQPPLVLPARGPLAPRPRLRIVGTRGDDVPVQVTALKPSEDGQAWIVRLFGARGRTAQVRLDWADPRPRVCYLTDNSESPRQVVSGPIEVPAATLVTLRVEP